MRHATRTLIVTSQNPNHVVKFLPPHSSFLKLIDIPSIVFFRLEWVVKNRSSSEEIQQTLHADNDQEKNLQGRGAFLLSRELRQWRQSSQTSAKPGITIPWHTYLNAEDLKIYFIKCCSSHLAVTSHWMFLSYNYLIVCDASCAISCNVWERERDILWSVLKSKI